MKPNEPAQVKALTLAELEKPDVDDDVQRRFLKFHAAHPHVYQLIVRYAKEALPMLARSRRGSYSVKCVIERVRWHIDFEAKGLEPVNILNEYSSRYARLVMRNEPELRGVFALRPLRSTGGRW